MSFDIFLEIAIRHVTETRISLRLISKRISMIRDAQFFYWVIEAGLKGRRRNGLRDIKLGLTFAPCAVSKHERNESRQGLRFVLLMGERWESAKWIRY